jgi:hypothetical protein
VVRGKAPDRLLDSYDVERRPVGADVVARTRAASQQYGREEGGRPDRYADTQLRVSYRATDWVRDDAPDLDPGIPVAGDRAPEVVGLRRKGIGFPIRLFDVLRGTEHVLMVHLSQSPSAEIFAGAIKLAQDLRTRFGSLVRVVAISDTELADEFALACYRDAEREFAKAYGPHDTMFLVRPDGYIGWRGQFLNNEGLIAHLSQQIGGPSPSSSPGLSRRSRS